jgi:hypothetical protein
MKEAMDDHEDRLREKNRRLTVLEQEAKHMGEKLDNITKTMAEVKASLDSLKQWQLYLMGGAGALAVVYSLLSAHWSTIVRVLGGGA